MKPELILRSDMLDILFENRNKSYGAYYLRRHYNSHLMAGILGMVIFSVGLWVLLPGHHDDDTLNNPVIFQVTDTIQLTKLDDFIKPIIPPKHKSTPKQDIAISKSLDFVIDPELTRPVEPDPSSNGQNPDGTETQSGDPGNGETPGPNNDLTQAAIAAPIPPPVEVEPEVYLSPAVMPQFPGGEAALQRWLSRQLRPGDDLLPGQRVKVVVRFVVNRSGFIDRIELLQPGGEPYDKEVLRVINKMPKWEAGRQNGQNVAVWFAIPIIFEMSEQ